MVRPGELTGTECRVLATVAAGEELDLQVGDPELDDPGNGAAWDETRSVRAEFIYALCVGAHDEWRVHARGLCLRGARITGALNFEAASVAFPLTLRDCYFDQPLVLREARLATLRLPGTRVPSIRAEQLELRANLELNDGFHAHGEVNLLHAHIGGWMDCRRGTFANPSGHALNADGLRADRHVLWTEGFHAHGEVRLLSAHIGGWLACDGGTFINPSGGPWTPDTPPGRALNADSLTAQHVFCGYGFRAEGEVNLVGAHIGGQLDCTGGTFTNLNGFALNAYQLEVGQSMSCRDGFHSNGVVDLRGARIGGQLNCDGGTFTNLHGPALNADRLIVDQDMYCRNGFHARGEVRLAAARIGSQLDCDGGTFTNPEGYALDAQGMTVGLLFLRPAKAPEGVVDLRHAHVGLLVDTQESWPTALRSDRFVYDSIRAIPEVSVEQRLDWLTRDPDGYSPQKYEQLAAVYRGAGQEQEARQVAIAKQRARRQQLPRPARLWNRLLEVAVGYGYQPWRAVWWLLGFVVVGSLLFARAYPEALTATAPADQLPVFVPVVYALDVLLPIVDLRQQDFWIPNAGASWGWLYLGWFWLSIGAGWLLATAVAAAVTGLLKPTDPRA